ncbi:MAG: potassium transporter TrkG, partial [Hydrogenophaga sp.]
MISIQPALHVFSRVLMAFSFAFLMPLGWAWFEDQEGYRFVWEAAFALALICGALAWAATREHQRELLPKDGFLLVNMVWLLLPAFSAVPLMFTVPGITWSQAYFEAMSALTGTGATALAGLDALPVSVNIWRCFLQLIGGLGIMLLVVAVLPLLGLGGVQLYKAETPGPMKDTRFTPRIAQTARGLWAVYFLLSAACLLAYRWAGMGWADAFMHSCTTMGLGGFSSHDASLGFFRSERVEVVSMFFMAISGISFVRYFIVLRNRTLRPLTRDREIRSYVTILALSVGLVAVLLLVHEVYADPVDALRQSAFHVISVATTTGFTTTDYGQWPVFAPVLMMFLGTFVSCAGSTGGGIKLVRMLLLVKQARRELVRIVHPRVVNPVTLGGQVVPPQVMATVLGFMLIYGAATMGLTMLLLFTGLDIVTGFSAVVATLNNIGPGLGQVGPASHFGVLSGLQLNILSFSMVLGRLELLTFLVLFTSAFWRR